VPTSVILILDIQCGENLIVLSEHTLLDDDIYSDLDQMIALRKGKQS